MLKSPRFFGIVASAALAMTLLFGRVLRAEEISWLTDFDAAKAKAKAEDKMVFAFFTGSDWCVWCKKLQGEVLNKEEFQKTALKQYIFLELDYPREKEQPAEIKERNKKLAQQYKIAGYPSVILMDAEGHAIVKTGYQKGGPEAYLKHLDEFLAIYKEILQWKKDVEKLAGADRAKLLDKIVDGYDKLSNTSEEVATLRKEIIALDPDNALKLKNKHTYCLLAANLQELMQSRKFDEISPIVDKILALPDLTAAQKFDTYKTKSIILVRNEDYAGSLEAMEKALAIDPQNKGADALKDSIFRIKTFHAVQQKIDAAQAKVDKAEGVERAKALLELFHAHYEMTQAKGFLPTQKNDIDPFYEQIVKLDPDDTIHCRAEFQIQKDLIEAQRLINSKDPDDKDNGKELCEKALAKPGITDLQKQEGYYTLGWYNAVTQDIPEAIAMFKKALEIAPESVKADHCKASLSRLDRPAQGQKIEWLTDFDAAKAKAKAEDKMVFAFFTGSDWCVWCKKLQGEVLNKEEFQKTALKQYIFLELDYPREKEQPAEIKERNKKLAQQYKISGYPSVILMDAEGQAIIRTGYKAGGPEAYLKHLDEFLAIYKNIQQWKKDVEKLAGADRAKLLDKIVDGYDKLSNTSEEVATLRKEIIALDPDNALKLKNKHTYGLLVANSQELLRTRKFEELSAVVDQILALPDLTAEQKFENYYMKGMLLVRSDDYVNAASAIEKALASDPENKKASDLKLELERVNIYQVVSKKIDAAQAKVDKAEGVERAKALLELFHARYEMTQAYGFLPTTRELDPIAEEIAKLDPDDTIHCREEFQIQKDLIEAQRLLNSKDLDEMDKGKELCDKVLAQPGISNLQKQEAFCALAWYCVATQEIPEAIALYKKALEIAPESAKAYHIKGSLSRYDRPAPSEKKADGTKTGEKEKGEPEKKDKN